MFWVESVHPWDEEISGSRKEGEDLSFFDKEKINRPKYLINQFKHDFFSFRIKKQSFSNRQSLMDEYLVKEGLGVWDEVMAGACLRVLCIHESLTSIFLLLIYSNRKKNSITRVQ